MRVVYYTPCPEKKDRTLTNLDKIFIIFGTDHPDSPCDWKIVKCPINTCTALRDDDVIVTSLKNAVSQAVSGEKRDRQYFGHNFDKVKYIVVIVCKEYRDECETTHTTKVASPNQCRCFTLRTKQ